MKFSWLEYRRKAEGVGSTPTMFLVRKGRYSMEICVKKNELTGGVYAVFEHKGSWHYADLSSIGWGRNECMIFPCDKDGNNVDFGCEEFVAYPNAISEENLKDCIDMFCAGWFVYLDES